MGIPAFGKNGITVWKISLIIVKNVKEGHGTPEKSRIKKGIFVGAGGPCVEGRFVTTPDSHGRNVLFPLLDVMRHVPESLFSGVKGTFNCSSREVCF